ncbi:hypothetical protein F4861DRAFT_532587 [Xylaria intraflava]|nr:hypothetical protein F4861DRAFT_532587 [Xylaria intraflava]
MALSVATADRGVAQTNDGQPLEFILNTNWALRPEGVKDFYEILYQREENWEIAYDPALRAFRIKCFSHQEAAVGALVASIMQELVLKEDQEALVSFPMDESAKIMGLGGWREDESQDANIQHADKYSYPRDVALRDFQKTWKLPESWSEEGITANQVFPKSALSKIQRLTGTTLIASSDGSTIYVGASKVEDITTAERKLHTLTKFFSLTPRDTTQVCGVFLHNEGDNSAMGEYRLMADGNKMLLRSYLLDRFEWPNPNVRYSHIFHKGATVRLNPKSQTQPLSDTILPITKDKNTKEEFAAFRRANWIYPAKDAQLPVSNTVVDEQTQCSALASHQPGLRPKIESWVSTIPDPTSDEHDPFRQADSHVGAQASQSSRWPNLASCGGSEQGQRAPEHAKSKPLTSPQPTGSASPIVLKQPKPKQNDPFANLWEAYRQVLTGEKPEIRKEQNNKSIAKASFVNDRPEPQVTKNDRKASKSLRLTMKQQAGSRSVLGGTRTRSMFSPRTMTAINKSLVELMAPLTMRPGIIDLRIDLGRFSFLDVKTSHIQKPGERDNEKHYELEQIRSELNTRHKTHDKLHFTRVLTTLAADANYIANLVDENGKQMWARPADGRSSFYEFTCRSKAANGMEWYFVVDIDAIAFTAKVRQFKCDESCFAIYCTKRAWDFRIILSVSQDLNDACASFAGDLARSLQVRSMSGGLPELEVSYDTSHNVEILAVRTRNEACCVGRARTENISSTQTESNRNVQKLYINEIWEMDRLSKTVHEHRIKAKFARFKSPKDHLGVPLVWYEFSLKSDALSEAFRQNEKLELGDEASWTAEELLKSRPVDDLVRKAASMVKKMDGVGYWNDNQQKDLLPKFALGRKDVQNFPVFW